jgi:hypothetical protein
MKRASDQQDPEKARKSYNAYLRFSAIGLQMAGVIMAGVFAGRWLDGLVNWHIPVFTLALALLSIPTSATDRGVKTCSQY